jgi:hypothetical protein
MGSTGVKNALSLVLREMAVLFNSHDWPFCHVTPSPSRGIAAAGVEAQLFKPGYQRS